jgi:hypothetical protein
MILDGVFSLHLRIRFLVPGIEFQHRVPESRNCSLGYESKITCISRNYKIQVPESVYSNIRTLKLFDFGRDAQFSLTYGRMYRSISQRNTCL